MKKLPNEKYFA